MSSYLVNGTCVTGPCYSMDTLVQRLPAMWIIALVVGITGVVFLIAQEISRKHHLTINKENNINT